jgi:hypothetical protein
VPLKAHPRIDHGIQHVDDQVDQQVDHRDEQQRPLDDREVAAEHSADHQTADAGQREHLFDHHGAAEQPAGDNADNGEYRHQRVRQPVARHHHAPGQPLGIGGADEVLVQHFEHR